MLRNLILLAVFVFAVPTMPEQGWRKFVTWPEGITAWAIMFTLGAIVWQACETRKAAQAALLNAQAVINAERALLLFTVEKEPVRDERGRCIFHIRATNYGKLPARRIEICKPVHATMTLEMLVASPPEYPEELEEIFEYLLPDKSCRVVSFVPSETSISDMARIAKNANTEAHLIENMIYGQITYTDGISLEIRHSRYCFTHEREPLTNIGGSLEPIGTEEYLECS